MNFIVQKSTISSKKQSYLEYPQNIEKNSPVNDTHVYGFYEVLSL